MITAALWGLFAGAALLVGAVIALATRIPTRVIGLIMGFGAGVLVSAVAFELTEESMREGGLLVTGTGLLAGALVFVAGDWWLGTRGAHRRKSPLHGGIHLRRHPPATPATTATTATAETPEFRGVAGTDASTGAAAATASGMTLVLGALLDGIPESAAIGISLLDGGQIGLAFVAAVFLSNLPEGMAATTGLKASGRSTRSILILWATVCLASALAAAVGQGVLAHGGPMALAGIQAFAGGAVLAMLATGMLPEAYEHGGRTVGLVTVLGFIAAVLLGEL